MVALKRGTEAVVRTNYPRAFMILAAVVLATILLLLIVATKPAEAAFPGRNGKIVFESNRTIGAGVDNPTGDSEIFVMNPDGTGLTQLTFNTALDGMPVWSGNGKKIAFRSFRDNNDEIYTMNADGSAQTNITNNPGLDVEPAFSRDGTKIVFRSQRTTGEGVDNPTGNSEIFTINLDGTGLKQLTFNTADDRDPTWSPDGTKIAFMTDRDAPSSGNFEVYTMNADGSN
jgi:Tol biopolymer transport system component